MSAGYELLHTKLNLTLERDGMRHGDHSAGLRVKWTTDCQLHGENTVGVTMANTVGSAVESADIVSMGLRGEMLR